MREEEERERERDGEGGEREREGMHWLGMHVILILENSMFFEWKYPGTAVLR